MKAKAKSKKATRAATAEKRAPKGTIPLKAICQKLGLDPKASRVRLRRHWRQGGSEGAENLSFHERGKRWDLSPKAAKEVETFLRG